MAHSQHDEPMRFGIHRLAENDYEDAARLIRKSFTHYVAPDWSMEASDSFCAAVSPAMLQTGDDAHRYCIGWFDAGVMTGVLIMPKPTWLRMLFVDPVKARQGIGSRLWNHACVHLGTHHPDIREVTLYASPYAYPFYQALGFVSRGEESCDDGMRATPMAYQMA